MNSGRIPSALFSLSSSFPSGVGSSFVFIAPSGSLSNLGQFAKALTPKVTSSPQTITVSRLVQPSKAEIPIVVISLGMLISVRPAQFLKAHSSITSPPQRITDFISVHPSNADLPIIKQLLGILTSVKEEQFLNADAPMLVISPQIIMVSRLVQFSNTDSLISVTELGMLKSTKLEQPLNAALPMLMGLGHIVIFTIVVQFSNAAFPILPTG